MRFPKTNINVTKYHEQVKSLLNDNECSIFIDTNILSQLYRLNDEARQDFYYWVNSCGNRFHVPVWSIHEYSDKIYTQRTREYLSELDKIKTQAKEFENISDFVKGYVGDSLLKGSYYQNKAQSLQRDVELIKTLLNRISSTINSNLKQQQQNVHKEIENVFSDKILHSDIYSLIPNIENEYQQRYENRIPPGYKDIIKEDNKTGDLIIWREILAYCKENNVKKAILLSRDSKSDIVYEPEEQIIEEGRPAGKAERIKVAKESLVYEFEILVGCKDFYVIDFRTFVRLFASEYRKLAMSFQLATAEEEKGEIDEFDDLLEKLISEDVKEGEEDSSCKTTGEDINTQYSIAAICDGQYDFVNTNGCMDSYIARLKSYNWYIQNPAINEVMKLKSIGQENSEINRSSVFVLGRNILQSAVGSSGSAISFLDNLSYYTRNWEMVYKKALVDGMLFEVYFNSKGEIRPLGFKGTYFKELISNIKKSDIENPYVFINERLGKITDRFVPQLGKSIKYVFKFNIKKDGGTDSLECNNIDISATFTEAFHDVFSTTALLPRALMQYYGIDVNDIEITGIPENCSTVYYIPMYTPVSLEDEDCPF